MGKLIVLDSFTDCCGKETQTKLLHERLLKEGYNVKRVSFPAYDRWHSVFVRDYLGGKFGQNPSDVNCLTASTFYALDRYNSFLEEWKEDYERGTIILCDRYISSNQIYQGSKIINPEERKDILNRLEMLENEVYKIPKADAVICLDLNPNIAIKIMKDRKNKIDNSDVKDIHESNDYYMLKCYTIGKDIAERKNWSIIKCDNGTEFLDVNDIHNQVYEEVLKSIKA